MSNKLTALANGIDPKKNPNISAFAVQAAKEIAALQAPVIVPVPGPVEWVVSAPGSTGKPVTTRTSSSWFMQGQIIEDERNVGGTNDSVYGLGDAAHTPAITMRRVLIRLGVNASLDGRGKHAVYGDHTGLIEDCDATVADKGFAASVFSPRQGNQTYRRCWASNDSKTGGPFLFGIYDSEPGKPLLIEDCRGISSQDTCVWVSTNPDKNGSTKVGLNITFKDCQFQGSAFAKVDMAAVQAGFRMNVLNCLLNGRPVTAADFPNVSPLFIDGVKAR